MSEQSFLAKIGVRIGVLGSLANLAIAAPLADGNYSPAAHTDASRMGFWFDRSVGLEFVGVAVMGNFSAAFGLTFAEFAGQIIAPASSASYAGLLLPQGVAPAAPTDGEVWTTTAGMYVRINGTTVGPLLGGSNKVLVTDTTEVTGSLGVLNDGSILTYGGIGARKKIWAQGNMESAGTVTGASVIATSSSAWSGVAPSLTAAMSTTGFNFSTAAIPGKYKFRVNSDDGGGIQISDDNWVGFNAFGDGSIVLTDMDTSQTFSGLTWFVRIGGGTGSISNLADGVAIGYDISCATGGFESLVAIGAGIECRGQNNTVIGPYAYAGTLAGAGVNQAVVLGYSAGAADGAGSGIAIGTFAAVEHSGSIVVGYNAFSTAANQCVLASITGIADYVLGKGNEPGTPVAVTIRNSSATGTNVAAGGFVIHGGVGTGNSSGGFTEIRAYAAGASGAAAQTSYSYARMTAASGLIVEGSSNTAPLQHWSHPGFSTLGLNGASEGYAWENKQNPTGGVHTMLGVFYLGGGADTTHVEWGRGLDRQSRMTRAGAGWSVSAITAIGRDQGSTTTSQTLFRIANRNPTATLALTGSALYFHIADYDSTTSTQTDLVTMTGGSAKIWDFKGGVKLQCSGKAEVYGTLNASAGTSALLTIGQWSGNPSNAETASCLNQPGIQGLTANSTGTVGLAANRTQVRTSANLVTARTATGIAGWYERGDLGIALGVGGSLALTNYYGGYVGDLPALAAGVTVTNQYGLFIEAPTRGSSIKRAIHVADGGQSFFGGQTTVSGAVSSSLSLFSSLISSSDSVSTTAGAFTATSGSGMASADGIVVTAYCTGAIARGILINNVNGATSNYAIHSLGTAVVELGGNLNLGVEMGASAAQINIGHNRSVAGDSLIDMIAESGSPNYNFRLRRYSGTNGVMELTHRGTGLCSIVTEDAADFDIKTSNVRRLLITSAGAITTAQGQLIGSSVAMTNGAGAAVGTLTNAPAAGNPTKWLAINDNGTTRYVPAW